MHERKRSDARRVRARRHPRSRRECGSGSRHRGQGIFACVHTPAGRRWRPRSSTGSPIPRRRARCRPARAGGARPSGSSNDARSRLRPLRAVLAPAEGAGRPREPARHHGLRRGLPYVPGLRREDWALDDPRDGQRTTCAGSGTTSGARREARLQAPLVARVVLSRPPAPGIHTTVTDRHPFVTRGS